jgi:hypothetical protein
MDHMTRRKPFATPSPTLRQEDPDGPDFYAVAFYRDGEEAPFRIMDGIVGKFVGSIDMARDSMDRIEPMIAAWRDDPALASQDAVPDSFAILAVDSSAMPVEPDEPISDNSRPFSFGHTPAWERYFADRTNALQNQSTWTRCEEIERRSVAPATVPLPRP